MTHGERGPGRFGKVLLGYSVGERVGDGGGGASRSRGPEGVLDVRDARPVGLGCCRSQDPPAPRVVRAPVLDEAEVGRGDEPCVDG